MPPRPSPLDSTIFRVGIVAGAALLAAVLTVLVVLVIVLASRGGDKDEKKDTTRNKESRVEADKGSGKKQTAATGKESAASGNTIYRKMLPSTVWILQSVGTNQSNSGTGALIDRDRKMILTANHVVARNRTASVFFPAFDDTGKVKNELRDYPAGAGLRGTVVFADPSRDLALIQLGALPGANPALPLAAKSAEPGDRLHLIGNFGINDANPVLWSSLPAYVRNVARKRVHLNTGQAIDAWMVLTESAVNPGDSGGPVVNDRGELVAVVCGFDPKSRSVSSFIDVQEVHAVVGRFNGR